MAKVGASEKLSLRKQRQDAARNTPDRLDQASSQVEWKVARSREQDARDAANETERD